MNLIQQLEAEAIEQATQNRAIPEFRPGDTLRVGVKVVEGERTRIQNFEGVCIARANSGLGSSFTVRKISFGEGVERVFPLYSPNIESIEVVRRGAVRRAKLYYLRGRTGKAARIAERRDTRGDKQPAAAAKLRRPRPSRAEPCIPAKAGIQGEGAGLTPGSRPSPGRRPAKAAPFQPRSSNPGCIAARRGPAAPGPAARRRRAGPA